MQMKLSISDWIAIIGIAVGVLLSLAGGSFLVYRKLTSKNTVSIAGDNIGSVTQVGVQNIISKKIYSSEQKIITGLAKFEGGQDTIDLDNAGTLTNFGTADDFNIELLLNMPRSTILDYAEVGKGNFAMDASFIHPEKSEATLYFSQSSGNVGHEISVAGRKFSITLKNIHRLNNGREPVVREYTFGISEIE